MTGRGLGSESIGGGALTPPVAGSDFTVTGGGGIAFMTLAFDAGLCGGVLGLAGCKGLSRPNNTLLSGVCVACPSWICFSKRSATLCLFMCINSDTLRGHLVLQIVSFSFEVLAHF